MSEDQDLPARPALSGRRERARLLGEDSPLAWDGDDTGQAVPGDRPPAAGAPPPPATGHLPRRVPGSAAGGRTAPPGVRPAEPVRLPRPADGAPSRGAFEPPPKSGEPAGPPDGEPLPSGAARQLPELKPASDSWSGAFEPTSRPSGGLVGTVLADDPRPAAVAGGVPLTSAAPRTDPGSLAGRTPPAGPVQQAGPAPAAGQGAFAGPVQDAGPASAAGQGPFARSAHQASPAPAAGQIPFAGPVQEASPAPAAGQGPFARSAHQASPALTAGQAPFAGRAQQASPAPAAGQAPFAGPAQQASPASLDGPGSVSSPPGLVPPGPPGSDHAVGGGRTGTPALARFGQAPGGLRTDGAAALAPSGRPSPADSALTRASRRSLAESALAPADRLAPADPPLAPARRRSAAESALAPPSQRGLPGAAGEASSTGPQPRPAGARPGAAGARPPARSPKAEPSWGSVLASTMRLWAQRRGRRWRATATAVLVLVVAAAGVTAGTVWMTSRHRATAGPSSTASPAAGHSAAPGAGAVSAAVSVRQTAARWVTRQVNRAAIVACDPAMCALLHNSGFPAANLVPVLPDTTDPLGADLVMATAVVRSQFGRRLTRVYAPLAIARFGTGNRRIDVRQVLPAGSQGAHAQLAAKLREARQSGRQLLANRQIRVSGQARTILSQGHVDERLLATLAALASQQPIDVLAFGDANPGAGKWVPLRSADLAAADPTRGMPARSYRRALTSFLRAQRGSLYRATSVTLRTTGAGIRVIRIAFAAPSP